MSTVPPNEQDDPDAQAAGPSDAMKDQLQNDVSSWMAARSDTTARQSAEVTVAAVKPPTPKSAPRAKKIASPAPQPVDTKKKPFGMSYDGMSQADYITYMISRGAR